MKVWNMGGRSGKVANQFIIHDDEGNNFFQSYSSIIAKIDRGGSVTLDEIYWDYSRTTSKYRAQFLGESTERTRRKIKSGEYKLANLNS